MTSSSQRPLEVALVALAAIIASFTFSSNAQASTYVIQQCNGGNDYVLEGGASGYVAQSTCGQPANAWLQVGSSAAVSPGAFRRYSFNAPAGTWMDKVTGNYQLQGATSSQNHHAFLMLAEVGQQESIVSETSGAGGFSTGFDTDILFGPISKIGIGMACYNSVGQGNCGARSGIFGRLWALNFHMRDLVAPAMPSTSGSMLNGWVNGTKSVAIAGSDTGAGVSAISTWANDELIDFALPCAPDTTKLKPCPSSGSDTTTYDVAASPFVQGSNEIESCVGEYGTNPQVTCRAQTVQVDTVAPSAPNSLDVAGGQGWRRDNEFDLSWSNPAQAHAPIVGATVRLTPAGGGASISTYYPGTGTTSADDIEVPAVGEWTAQVYLRDAAGNEALSNAATAQLRFDDTVPPDSDPEEANGWLNRGDIASGYMQEWEVPALFERPPSGIAGYRVVVNTNSDTDPCAGAADPRACGGPITEAGVDNNTRVLRSGTLAEGANYVHVAPVSGSGMRATDIGHTALKVDVTDPTTVLHGDGNGEWINHDANLQAVASDPLSGMVDTDEFPLDAPPSTFLVVDGQGSSDADSNVSSTISLEGTHQVSYFARDLAGNTESPSTGTVRIDKTEPSVAFTNAQDPDDPDELRAPVSDQLSGVVNGRISFRQDGGAAWKGLDTVLRNGQLVARVDSGDMRPGVTYEFRATASDKAGNTRTSSEKANGEPMKVVGPFRPTTRVADLKINGKAKAKVKYGKKAKVTGSVITHGGGRAVANVPVELTETFLLGAKKRTQTTVVSTDASGGFAATLKKGPSRQVTASYKGDRRYLGTTSVPAKLSVQGKVTLNAPSRVDSDKGITFLGKVKAKGAKLGRKGKRLEVQVRVGKRWKAVGKSIRTDKKGAFKLPYRFTATYTDSVTYEFRAVSLRERGFPYLPAKSKTRSVVVTP